MNKIGRLEKARNTAATSLRAEVTNFSPGVQKFKATCFRWKRMAHSPGEAGSPSVTGKRRIGPAPSTTTPTLEELLKARLC